MTCEHLGRLLGTHQHTIHYCNHFNCSVTDGDVHVPGGKMRVCSTACEAYKLLLPPPEKPTVSCILPTYNFPERTNVVEEAVYAFLMQDYPNKQLIICIDTAGQTIDFSHPQVKVINSESRYPSLGEKLNAMIEASDGDIICRWDDDDISLPNRISVCVEKIQGGLDYWVPGSIYVMTDSHCEWQKQRGWGHVQGVFTKKAWEAVGKYPLGYGDEDGKLHISLKNTKWQMGDPSEEPTFIYRWQRTIEHLSGHGTFMQQAFEANAVKGESGTYALQPHWDRDYVSLVKCVGKGRVAIRPKAQARVCVIGFPSKYGGADTELDHQITVWRAMGVDVHLVPTGEPDAGQKALGVAERGCIIHKARDWAACAGMDVISYCNGVFLENIEEIAKYARSTTFVNCMTWVFPKELTAHQKGLIDFFVYQTDHARERIQQKLIPANPTFRWAKVKPFFNASAFPYVPSRPRDSFRFCRVSRDDLDKFSKHVMPIFSGITADVPVSGTILGITARTYAKTGPAPANVECLAPGSRPAKDVYAASHVLIQSCDTYENLPRVAMEAMSSGTVPICDKRGGFTEIIEHGVSGFLCETPEEFIVAANALAAQPDLRQRMAEAARDRIAALYGFEESAKEWQAFFDTLAAYDKPKPIVDAPPAALTVAERALSMATVFARTATMTGLATEELISNRVAICNACPNLGEDSRCRICGCACNDKQEWFNKLAHPTAKCPDKPPRW